MGLHIPPPTIKSLVDDAFNDIIIDTPCLICEGEGCSKCNRTGWISVFIECFYCERPNVEEQRYCNGCGEDLKV